MSQKYLIRPFQTLGTPIGLLMSSYGAFVYGWLSLQLPGPPFGTNRLPAILYVNLESFAIEFQEIRGWGPVTGNLPFIALLIGIFFAALFNIHNNRYYFKKLRENNGKPVPEARLPPMMVGGLVFTGGLFLFGCQFRHSPQSRSPTDYLRDLIAQNQLLAIINWHRIHRVRIHHHLPKFAELPGRHFPPLQRQRYRSHHFAAIYPGRGLSAFCGANVPQHWGRLGHHGVWLHCRGLDSSSVSLFCVGTEDPCKESVEQPCCMM